MMEPSESRKVSAVTYKLRGEPIKAALSLNPGKIVAVSNSYVDLFQMLEYVIDNHPQGVILFVGTEGMSSWVQQGFPKAYFDKCIVAWGTLNPPLFPGEMLPMYAYGICFFAADMQSAIIRDARFYGAISVPTHWAIPAVRNLCISPTGGSVDFEFDAGGAIAGGGSGGGSGGFGAMGTGASGGGHAGFVTTITIP